jgi:hypothetical protein
MQEHLAEDLISRIGSSFAYGYLGMFNRSGDAAPLASEAESPMGR